MKRIAAILALMLSITSIALSQNSSGIYLTYSEKMEIDLVLSSTTSPDLAFLFPAPAKTSEPIEDTKLEPESWTSFLDDSEIKIPAASNSYCCQATGRIEEWHLSGYLWNKW